MRDSEKDKIELNETGSQVNPFKEVFIRKLVTYPGFHEKSKKITTKVTKSIIAHETTEKEAISSQILIQPVISLLIHQWKKYI